ncbi:histidine kinase [Pseudaminobacter sp. 19-2017]|uniref:Histidine kinase n=1 Tax=Pseudaminobacter soli (ex Zhang et al. 2022) TaxID=2831468 RepID=A0A942E5J3_9HYPH|nr:histidine kinase [Pseudaminobacter soli]MBS3651533.1 histidine kinase [Pseudaminobacter soli]
MADLKSSVSSESPPSAKDLRKTMVEEQLAEARKQDQARLRDQEKLTAFTDDFLKGQVNDDEVARVRRLVMNAVKEGKYEAMVYSFPSDLCSDSGRAINSGDPRWPESLQGKAKQFYERYLKYGKPQGFKLKAMIISFPGGMPGDVGFFLGWAPETD